MTTSATAERERLADLLLEVGPDVDTLCEGWTARDLTAHIVMRDRRPDGVFGSVVKPFNTYGEKVQASIAEKPWDELVRRMRSGPPWWSPMRIDAVDRAANTVEFFVHHEDVRRAQPGWSPRSLEPDLRDDLHRSLSRAVRMLVRKAPAGVVLEPTDGGEPITANKGEPVVTVRGPIGELVLFAYGRQSHAQVELDGPVDAVEAVRTAQLGF
jgi:uncharacterized protein (TIGR03085 family)